MRPGLVCCTAVTYCPGVATLQAALLYYITLLAETLRANATHYHATLHSAMVTG